MREALRGTPRAQRQAVQQWGAGGGDDVACMAKHESPQDSRGHVPTVTTEIQEHEPCLCAVAYPWPLHVPYSYSFRATSTDVDAACMSHTRATWFYVSLLRGCIFRLKHTAEVDQRSVYSAGCCVDIWYIPMRVYTSRMARAARDRSGFRPRFVLRLEATFAFTGSLNIMIHVHTPHAQFRSLRVNFLCF